MRSIPVIVALACSTYMLVSLSNCSLVIESCASDADCAGNPAGEICIKPEGASSGSCGIASECECFAGETRPCPNQSGICAGDDQTCGDDCKWIACGTPEVCDGLDNDCDGNTDEDSDLAADGAGEACDTTALANGVGVCERSGVKACVPDGAGGGTVECTDRSLDSGATDFSCSDTCSVLAPAARQAGFCDGSDNDCDGDGDEFDFQAAPDIVTSQRATQQPWSILESDGNRMLAIQAADTTITLVVDDGSATPIVENINGRYPILVPASEASGFGAVLYYVGRASGTATHDDILAVSVTPDFGTFAAFGEPVCVSCGSSATTDNTTFFDVTPISPEADQYLVVFNRSSTNNLHSVQVAEDLSIVPTTLGILLNSGGKDKDVEAVRIVPRRRDLIYIAMLRRVDANPALGELRLAPAIANSRVQFQEIETVAEAVPLDTANPRNNRFLIDMNNEPVSGTVVVSWILNNASGAPNLMYSRYEITALQGGGTLVQPIFDPVSVTLEGATALNDVNVAVIAPDRSIVAYQKTNETTTELEAQILSNTDGSTLGMSGNTVASTIQPRLYHRNGAADGSTNPVTYWGALQSDDTGVLNPVMDMVPCDL